jgi:hypothetical protein
MDKWKQLDEQLKGVFGHATIMANGYEVYFVKRLDRSEKLVIETYVNGQIKGEWMKAENEKPLHPEARFFHPRKMAAWKKKAYPALKRLHGKKKADAMITPKVILFSPVWGSSRTLIAHLKRNFPDLELIDDQAKQSA